MESQRCCVIPKNARPVKCVCINRCCQMSNRLFMWGLKLLVFALPVKHLFRQLPKQNHRCFPLFFLFTQFDFHLMAVRAALPSNAHLWLKGGLWRGLVSVCAVSRAPAGARMDGGLVVHTGAAAVILPEKSDSAVCS